MHHAVTYYLGRTPEGKIEIVSFDDYRTPRVGSIQNRLLLSVKRRSDSSMDTSGTRETRHLLVYRLKKTEEKIAALWQAAELIGGKFAESLAQFIHACDTGITPIETFYDAAKTLGFSDQLKQLFEIITRIKNKRIPPPIPKKK